MSSIDFVVSNQYQIEVFGRILLFRMYIYILRKLVIFFVKMINRAVEMVTPTVGFDFVAWSNVSWC